MASASAIAFARLIVDSIAFAPIAVSWERIKLSAPSRVAVVISESSYLLGYGSFSIDSRT